VSGFHAILGGNRGKTIDDSFNIADLVATCGAADIVQ
jgi:hypothetical protein